MILLLLALLVKSTYVRYLDFFTNLLYLHKKKKKVHSIKMEHTFFIILCFFGFSNNWIHGTSIFLYK